MKISFLSEPELEFGAQERHVDIRYGLMQGGPLDRDSDNAPKLIRLGVIGTAETIDGVLKWLEQCAHAGVAAKKSRLSNLFPAFPGYSRGGCFDSAIAWSDQTCRAIPNDRIETIAKQTEYSAIADATDLFFEEMRALEEVAKVDVIVVALPEILLHLDSDDDEDEESTEVDEQAASAEMRLNFRRMLKAKSMKLNAPIQIVLPATYGAKTKRNVRSKKPQRVEDKKPLQDEATRAWNLFTALYYKAGGIPWRITRQSADLQNCFIGVSFYQNMAADSLKTSIAQVFNERGEGIIVRGAPVTLTKNDRQPHLSRDDATHLIASSIKAFREFHRHSPARVVLHKSSSYGKDELDGFKEAISNASVELSDLLWIDRSRIRLFRDGIYPPLRGMLLTLDEHEHVLYTRGSVDFFRTYPGLYVPTPRWLRLAKTEQPIEILASEILALTKLNWNKTQFDGSEPITLNAARHVGEILKYVPDGDSIKPRYSFYM